MVGMVKRLTRRIVAPLRAGSNPVTHPNFSFWGVAKSVRHRTLTPVCVGSSPATPAKFYRMRSAQIKRSISSVGRAPDF